MAPIYRFSEAQAAMQPSNSQGESDSTRTRVQPGSPAAGISEIDGLRAALTGRYSVEREVGAGGMGRVYRCARRISIPTAPSLRSPWRAAPDRPGSADHRARSRAPTGRFVI